jgi:hypothetical protein
MENNKTVDLNALFQLIAKGDITEIEAERLINATARLESGVPTGITANNRNKL